MTLHLASYSEAFLSGELGGMKITEEFLLVFAVIMQIPMIMIVLSRFLTFTLNKYSNIVAALLKHFLLNTNLSDIGLPLSKQYI